MDIVRQKVPAPSVQARKAALAAAGQYLLSRGVTSVGDMGWGLFGLPNDTWNDLELVYDWAAQQDKLPLRCGDWACGHGRKSNNDPRIHSAFVILDISIVQLLTHTVLEVAARHVADKVPL